MAPETETQEEQQEQQALVEATAPAVATLLNAANTHELVGEERTAAFEPETNTLTLTENDTGNVVMDARWDGEQEVWVDQGSSLTEEDRDRITQTAEDLSLEQPSNSNLER